MSKHQLHEEFEKFSRYIQSLIKLDNELGQEIKEIHNFRRKKLQDESTRSKIT